MFDLWLQVRQPRGGIKHRNGLYALPKKHTSGQRVQVILSDTETTSWGVLCLAPIGRLACMTTRSSRSCCSALRSIRQSKNVSDRCIKKIALKTTRTAASGLLGRDVPFAFRLGNTQMAERARHDIAGVIGHQHELPRRRCKP